MTVATNAEVGTIGEAAPTTAGVAGTTTAAPGLVNSAVLLWLVDVKNHLYAWRTSIIWEDIVLFRFIQQFPRISSGP